MSKVDLKVSGNATIDATVSTVTDPFQIDRSFEWSLISVLSGTDNDPTIEIQGTNDLVNWKNPYEDQTTPGTPLILTLDETINSVFDSIFPFEYYRIKTEPNGTTAGTLTHQLSIFKDE